MPKYYAKLNFEHSGHRCQAGCEYTGPDAGELLGKGLLEAKQDEPKAEPEKAEKKAPKKRAKKKSE